jgi:mitochondrial fission protein ELM1
MAAVHVGFPRISPAWFDLVIATPQYPIPDHPNLLRVPYALTRTATAVPDRADMDLLSSLSQPRRLLIVGGPTLYWNIDQAALLGSLSEMLAEASSDGGSVLVTTSPRTPPRLADAIARALDSREVQSMLARPGYSPRYASLLAAADSIRITADSVAMVSDAIWTGKPVALVPVVKSALGRIVIGVMDRFRQGKSLYPQDLRLFWQTLRGIGIGEQTSRPKTSTDEQMSFILARVRPLVEPLRSES